MGAVIAIIILSVTARVFYRNHQNRVFWDSLQTRQSDISKEDFETVCKNRDSCVGRFIVWDGIVDGDASEGTNEFMVKSANGRAKVHTVDALPMNLHDGDEIIFDGFLGEVNNLFPDIVNTGYVRKVVATAADLAKQKQEADEREKASQAQQATTTAQVQQTCDAAIPAEVAAIKSSANYGEWVQTEAAVEDLETFYSMPAAGKEPDSVVLTRQLLTFQKQQLIANGQTEDGLQAGVVKFKNYYAAEMSRFTPGSEDALRVEATPLSNFLKSHYAAIEPTMQACHTTNN
jgi:hypothetical protein